MCHRCSEQEREQEQHKPDADPSMTVAVTGINILIKTTTCEKYTKGSLENSHFTDNIYNACFLLVLKMCF